MKVGVSLAGRKGERGIPGEERRGAVLAKAQRRTRGYVYYSSRDRKARHAGRLP